MKLKLKRNKYQAGLTLVEILIAVTIGLMIMAGVVQLYATSSKTQLVQEGTSRLQENARYIFSRLAIDLSQSGFLGCLNMEEGRVNNVLSQNAGIGGLFDYSQPLTVTDGDQILGTDSLVVRYAANAGRVPLVAESSGVESIWVDDTHGNYASLEQFQIVMVSNCSLSTIFMITNDPDGSGGEIQHLVGVADPDGQSNGNPSLEGTFGYTQVNANTRQYPYGHTVAYLYPGGGGAHSYSLGTSAAAVAGNVCSAANSELCALFKNGQEIAQGVEDFQVQVGWVDGVGNSRFSNAGVVADWSAVDRLRVTLTLNTINDVPNAQGGGLDRQTFTRTFMLRNQLL